MAKAGGACAHSRARARMWGGASHCAMGARAARSWVSNACDALAPLAPYGTSTDGMRGFPSAAERSIRRAMGASPVVADTPKRDT
eukprot:5587276-Prymnesium_polylepis.1